MSDGLQSGGALDDVSAAEVLSRTSEAVLLLDEDWTVAFCNERAQRLFEQRDDLQGREFWTAFPGAVGTAFEEGVREAAAADRPVEFEAAFPPLDRWFETRAYPTAAGLSVHVRDVTARKEREREVAERDARYRAIAETASDAIVTIDSESTVRFANPATEDVFGYEPSELVGEPLTVLMPEALRARHMEALARYLSTGACTMDWTGVQLPGLRKDGEEIALSVSFGSHRRDGERHFTGIVRDVTERERQETALRDAYGVLSDPDAAFAEKIDRLLDVVRETLGVEYGTLSRINEADGDYVFEAVAAPDGADLEPGDVASLETTNCERVAETRETLVLDDVARDAPELADRAGNAEWGISSYLGAPVIVEDEVYGTFCFYAMEPRDDPFSEWEVAFVNLLGNWVSYELQRQRHIDRLAALNDLHEVVHGITDAVVDQSTREDVESVACRRLAASDSYLFAWIGEVDPATEEVELRAEAGVDGYLDDLTISVDPGRPESYGPTGRALATGDVQVTQDPGTDPTYAPWRATADAFGYRSSAAVPIVHEGSVYGVLNLYTERANAFENDERDVVALLGQLLGHAIAATDRKRALMSESVVELEFRVRDALAAWGTSEPPGRLTLTELLPLGGDEYLGYGTAPETTVAAIEERAGTDPHWSAVSRIREMADGRVAIELRFSEPSLFATVASLTGDLERLVVDDGDCWVTVRVPRDADVRRLLEPITDRAPGTQIVSKQATVRTDHPSDRVGRVLAEELTDRQREALRAAYHAGFFEWPRDTSGEAVGESLGVSPATFHQHLRAAERKFFDALFGDAADP